MTFQLPKGTTDILPENQKYWKHFFSLAEKTANNFGYKKIDTPVFEDAGLFARGIGQITDIVEKETYTFKDRGNELLTLRPEGTAPVCRAYLQHGLYNLPQPVRMYYLCPVFRYERPQSGRFRQHHQFGVELFGDGDAAVDAEIIEIAWRLLETIGIKDLNLGINSIGDSLCRVEYIDALQCFYSDHISELCEDCVRRLSNNPLRLLDCKQTGCQPIIDQAPHSTNHLCAECQYHWDNLLVHLNVLNLPYNIDHRLVRGFDYYTRTVFEISPPTDGRQSTIVGGGRYDGLIEELGGKPTSGAGFGMGIERVINLMKTLDKPVPDDRGIDVLIAYVGKNLSHRAFAFSSELRRAGLSAILAPGNRNLRSQLRYASSNKADFTIILGEDELDRKIVILRNMDKGEQQELAFDIDTIVRAIQYA